MKVYCSQCKFYKEINSGWCCAFLARCEHPANSVDSWKKPDANYAWYPEDKNKLNDCSYFEGNKKYRKKMRGN